LELGDAQRGLEVLRLDASDEVGAVIQDEALRHHLCRHDRPRADVDHVGRHNLAFHLALNRHVARDDVADDHGTVADEHRAGLADDGPLDTPLEREVLGGPNLTLYRNAAAEHAHGLRLSHGPRALPQPVASPCYHSPSMPSPEAPSQVEPAAVEAFIARWKLAGGSERANYQLFLTELAALLDLPRPDPASDDTRENAYVFERRVTFRHGDGTESSGFIDLYRRGAFVLEAKKLRQTGGS